MLQVGLLVGMLVTTTYSAALSRPNLQTSPYELVPYESTNYLEQLATLQENEERYRNTPLWDEFAQLFGTTYSYVGNYREALAYFDSLAGVKPAGEGSNRLFSTCTPNDALSVVVQKAANSRAVFINEAHHVPQHRVFTRELLEALYKQGFRYFASETLAEYDASLNERGYPLLKETGYYTDEPLYGDLIRKALELGYTVVPYESQGMDESQNEREAAQARNLMERVFRNDPAAKLVVHAGYGHIDEQGDGGWLPMAKVFKQLSGIDPLTIEQTSTSERSRVKYESVHYREAVATFEIKTPTIIVCAGKPWVAPASEGHYDLMVFLPRSIYVNGRPTWLALGGERTPYLLPRAICQLQPRCLVQARFADESQDAVPVDRLAVQQKARQVALMLPHGHFSIQVLDINETIIAEFDVRQPPARVVP